MLEYILTLIAACAVFFLFILVFIRKDQGGQRGHRLAGCQRHGSEGECDRCRDHNRGHTAGGQRG